MDEIALTQPYKKYADDIWEFRRELLQCDVEIEDQFAGCLSLDVSKSAEEWIRNESSEKQYLPKVEFMKKP